MQAIKPYLGKGKASDVNSALCYDPREPIIKSSGKYLPHWYQEGKLYFITFRLGDSLPSSKLESLSTEYEAILKGEFLPMNVKLDEYLASMEFYLRQGYGECLLKYEEIQKIVIESIEFLEGKEYDLYDFVIMPNHVHMLVLPYSPPRSFISNLKRFTSNKVNKILDRKKSIWQEDFFDRIIRSVNDFNEKSEYIKQNPLSI